MATKPCNLCVALQRIAELEARLAKVVEAGGELLVRLRAHQVHGCYALDDVACDKWAEALAAAKEGGSRRSAARWLRLGKRAWLVLYERTCRGEGGKG